MYAWHKRLASSHTFFVITVISLGHMKAVFVNAPINAWGVAICQCYSKPFESLV